VPTTALGWTLALLGTIAGYELVRQAVVRRVRQRLRDGAVAFVRRHNVRLESARFIDRLWLREALLVDPAIRLAMVEVAQADGIPLAAVRMRVEHYVDEIAPAFSITAYYRVAAVLSRLVVEFAYEVVFDRSEVEAAVAAVPEGAVPVYVINHRSNADYVVLSYGLLRHVALSYAVGEWARVWPLDVLFRAFGSYFVRRGERDHLYHRVLERYVQVLVGQGGVTGFFIEGGLSRDGLLRPPKAGLLDYLIGVRRHEPDRELAFIPVGINFDRVLEDRNLTAEAMGRVRRPSMLEKAASLLWLLARLPLLIGANMVRVALRSHRKLGYAAVHVGRPVLLSELALDPDMARLPREQRRPLVDDVAKRLLQAVGRQVPATPVPLLCFALLQPGGTDDDAVVERVRCLLAELRAVGCPLAFGRAFPRLHEAESGIPGLDQAAEELNESQVVVFLAGFALERRKLVVHDGGRFQVLPEHTHLLRYYANSLVHHIPETAARLPPSPLSPAGGADKGGA